jgi:hypothetical protein
VRICQAAAARGCNLSHTLFIVGAEPLTPAKHREIKASGAAVYSRYYSTELGSIALGCGDPVAVGELHLLSDTVVLVQGDQEEGEGEARPFYLTVFSDAVPKVLVNAQIGDAGIVEQRHCGCILGECGLSCCDVSVKKCSPPCSVAVLSIFNGWRPKTGAPLRN